MLSDAQMDVVLDAYDSKYGTKGPRDKHGFPRASYRWHGFLAAYETLLPVIDAGELVFTHTVAKHRDNCCTCTRCQQYATYRTKKREAGL